MNKSYQRNPPPGIEMPVWYGKPAEAGFPYQKVVETTFSQAGANACLHPEVCDCFKDGDW